MRDRQTGPFRGLGGDLRYGLRSLRQHPALAAIALVTLSLGSGANAAIFSVVNAVLLRPLPFAEPDRIVAFWGSVPQMGIRVLDYPDAAYVYYRTRSQTLEHVSAYTSFSTTLTGAGDPERLNAAAAGGLLPRRAAARSAPGGSEDQRCRAPDRAAAAAWRRPAVVGKALTSTATLHRRGVMPPGFDFLNWSGVPLGPTRTNSTAGATDVGPPADEAPMTPGARWLSDDFGSERKGQPPTDPS
jgi:putative ABC transport system permease protein